MCRFRDANCAMTVQEENNFFSKRFLACNHSRVNLQLGQVSELRKQETQEMYGKSQHRIARSLQMAHGTRYNTLHAGGKRPKRSSAPFLVFSAENLRTIDSEAASSEDGK